MFTTITAKRAGKCARCEQDIDTGARCRYGYGKIYHFAAECPKGNPQAARTPRTRLSQRMVSPSRSYALLGLESDIDSDYI